ncbi:TIGR03085 family metal-binding protein [Propioniciclava flava]
MGFAKLERAALCAALDAVDPGAPTLCEGWNAHDLAAHLWLRENDPLSMPGMFLPALSGVTRSRTERLLRRWDYRELVDRIRRGPLPPSLFALPGVNELANTAEFFIHGEDVRRANGNGPRVTTPAFENQVARSLASMAKLFLRDAPSGIVLERSDTHERLRVLPGATTITLVGVPSELLLFASGRMSVAEVRAIGDEADVAELYAHHQGM